MRWLFALLACIPASALPTCSAGSQQTVKITQAFTLDASGSSGSGSLTYLWTVLSSAGSTSIVAPTSATTTATGNGTFGTYQFQVAVTDMNGTTTCSVKKGAVVADSNNVIDRGQEGCGVNCQKIVGPLIMYGQNTYPWADDRHTKVATQQIANGDTSGYLAPYWLNYESGTATITNSSATVTTSAATGQNPCSGGTVIIGGSEYMYLKYTGAVDGRDHWMAIPIANCVNPNQFTLVAVYTNAGDTNYINCPSGCTVQWGWGAEPNFGTGTANSGRLSNWIYTSSPNNFYSVIKMYYRAWLRTGIDTYHTAFQTLSDNFWNQPWMDQGIACRTDGSLGQICYQGFMMFWMEGVVLRALEEGPSSPKWVGLRYIWTRAILFTNYLLVPGTLLDDLRTDGGWLSILSMCGFTEPDAGQKATCQARVATLGASYATRQSSIDDGWDTFCCSQSNGTATSSTYFGGMGSASVVNGSPNVTIVGNTAIGAPSIGGYAVGNVFWTWNAPAATVPADNTHGDSKAYVIASVDAPAAGNQVIHLTENYAGATQTLRGFSIGSSSGQVGWGAPPFQMAHMGQAFGLAYWAMENYNTPVQTQYQSFLHKVVVWLITYGHNPGSIKGLYNYVTVPAAGPCGAQPYVFVGARAQDFCFGSNNFYPGQTTAEYQQLRGLSMEVIRTLSQDYLFTFDPAVQAFGDMLVNEMFAKPMTGGPAGDGMYLQQYDDDGFAVGAVPPIPKWAGQFCGFEEACDTWAATRVATQLHSRKIEGSVVVSGTTQ